VLIGLRGAGVLAFAMALFWSKRLAITCHLGRKSASPIQPSSIRVIFGKKRGGEAPIGVSRAAHHVKWFTAIPLELLPGGGRLCSPLQLQ
jgi:hypothetical protein